MSVLVLEKGEGSGVRFRFQPKCSKFVTVVLVHLGPKKIIRNFFCQIRNTAIYLTYVSDTIFLFFFITYSRKLD